MWDSSSRRAAGLGLGLLAGCSTGMNMDDGAYIQTHASTFDSDRAWHLTPGLTNEYLNAHPERPQMPNQPTTFVGLSSYRDPRCGRTLFEIYTKAKRPDDMFVGVVDQLAPDDPKVSERPDSAHACADFDASLLLQCLDVYCMLMKKKKGFDICPYVSQINVTTMKHTDSRGPTLARAKQQFKIKNEDFCLQCDAHSMLNQDFEEELRQQWWATENENAVLTTYVQDVDDYGINIGGRHEVPHMCKTEWGGNGVVRNKGAIEAANLPRPKLTALWGAGLSFSKCHAEKTVPYDPHLPQIFDGEEFSRSARLWTNGYDMYTPTRGIVFHDYRGHMYQDLPSKQINWNSDPPPEAAALKALETATSTKRLYTLLGIPGGDGKPLGRYGFGTVRSWDAYKKFSGVYPERHVATEGVSCGDLDFVPFEAHALPQQPAGPANRPEAAEEGGGGDEGTESDAKAKKAAEVAEFARLHPPQTFDGGHTWNLEPGLANEYKNGHPPAPVFPHPTPAKPHPSLFIGLASYRDVRCGATLYEVYTKAKYPLLVRVGVVDQLAPGDPKCKDVYCKLMHERKGVALDECPYLDQINVTTVPHTESKGPTLARYLQQGKIQTPVEGDGFGMGQDDFCLQCDAHSMFNPGFDTELVDQWAATENEYAVLTTYVQDIKDIGERARAQRAPSQRCCRCAGRSCGGRAQNDASARTCCVSASCMKRTHLHASAPACAAVDYGTTACTLVLTRRTPLLPVLQSNPPVIDVDVDVDVDVLMLMLNTLLLDVQARTSTTDTRSRTCARPCGVATRSCATSRPWRPPTCRAPSSPRSGAPASPSASATPRRACATTRTCRRSSTARSSRAPRAYGPTATTCTRPPAASSSTTTCRRWRRGSVRWRSGTSRRRPRQQTSRCGRKRPPSCGCTRCWVSREATARTSGSTAWETCAATTPTSSSAVSTPSTTSRARAHAAAIWSGCRTRTSRRHRPPRPSV
jgi:hypothetical protein